jgi:N-acetylglutamate synthase-like GNAT family acetyltransferase
MNVLITRASEADGPSIVHLLRDSGLPIDGLVDHLNTALVARDSDAIVGCAAVEIHSDGALLRSVAVAPAARGRGVGERLTEAALALARSHRIPAVYLLTTTAESYFPRFGFVRTSRDLVPAGVRQSVEFRSACPASAIVMRKALNESEKGWTGGDAPFARHRQRENRE